MQQRYFDETIEASARERRSRQQSAAEIFVPLSPALAEAAYARSGTSRGPVAPVAPHPRPVMRTLALAGVLAGLAAPLLWKTWTEHATTARNDALEATRSAGPYAELVRGVWRDIGIYVTRDAGEPAGPAHVAREHVALETGDRAPRAAAPDHTVADVVTSAPPAVETWAPKEPPAAALAAVEHESHEPPSAPPSRATSPPSSEEPSPLAPLKLLVTTDPPAQAETKQAGEPASVTPETTAALATPAAMTTAEPEPEAAPPSGEALPALSLPDLRATGDDASPVALPPRPAAITTTGSIPTPSDEEPVSAGTPEPSLASPDAPASASPPRIDAKEAPVAADPPLPRRKPQWIIDLGKQKADRTRPNTREVRRQQPRSPRANAADVPAPAPDTARLSKGFQGLERNSP